MRGGILRAVLTWCGGILLRIRVRIGRLPELLLAVGLLRLTVGLLLLPKLRLALAKLLLALPELRLALPELRLALPELLLTVWLLTVWLLRLPKVWLVRGVVLRVSWRLGPPHLTCGLADCEREMV